MKTIVLEDLDLPEERRQALKREALRRGVPLNTLVSEFLNTLAERIVIASQPPSKAA